MSQKPGSFVILICKGILRDRTMRRQALAYIISAALVLLGLGVAVLDGWLAQHVLLFLLYWAACLWLTLTSMLLALYDMLAVRAELQKERRELRLRKLDSRDPDEPTP